MLESTRLVNFPSQPTSFVGRGSDIEALQDLLINPDCRLITLVGPGGTGKTRLSLELGAHAQDTFPEGVYFVPLAHVNTIDEIVTTVIRVLGIQASDSDNLLGELCRFLSQQKLLLIFDNFEHITANAYFLSDILSQAPHVKMLVTSREVLHLQEEWLWHVKGLPFPTDIHSTNVEQYSAVQLFLDRARQRVRVNTITEADIACTIRICQLVDGMPLALELAASWLNTLTCNEIATEIQNNIDLLATQLRNVPQRHRSIRAVFEHSWLLCEDAEQVALRRLSVFCGGFEREAARDIAGVSLQTLAALVEKSMIFKLSSGRYGIHELIRHYAQEKLNEVAGVDAIRAAHMQYFADFMHQRTIDITGRDQRTGLNKIDAEYDNIRTAWQHAVRTQADQALDKMMDGLVLFYEMYSRFQEGDALFHHTMQSLIPTPNHDLSPVQNRLRANQIRVWLLLERYPIPDTIQTLLADTLKTAQQQADEVTTAWCLWAQGEFERKAFYKRQHNRAHEEKASLVKRTEAYYHQAMSIFTRLDQPYAVARQLRGLAFIHLQLDDSDFEQYNSRLITLAREMGDTTGIAHALVYAAIHNERHQDLSKSDQLLQEAASIWQTMGDQKSLSYSLQYLALHALLRGDFIQVNAYAQQLMTIGKDINLEYLIKYSDALTAFVVVVHGDYHGAQQRILQRGYSWTKDLFKLSDLTLCLSAVGLGQHDEATRFVQHALTLLVDNDIFLESIQWIIAAALVLTQRKDYIRVVELLALVLRQEEATIGWLKFFKPILDVQATLERELGAPTVKTASIRGEKRDLRLTLMELRTYFDDTFDDSNEGEAISPTVNQTLVEPLTGRELDVLRLIVAGLSNRDIADELTLAIGTVKTHAHNLYSKLDVSNRTEAAAIAHELNLF